MSTGFTQSIFFTSLNTVYIPLLAAAKSRLKNTDIWSVDMM